MVWPPNVDQSRRTLGVEFNRIHVGRQGNRIFPIRTRGHVPLIPRSSATAQPWSPRSSLVPIFRRSVMDVGKMRPFSRDGEKGPKVEGNPDALLAPVRRLVIARGYQPDVDAFAAAGMLTTDTGAARTTDVRCGTDAVTVWLTVSTVLGSGVTVPLLSTR